MGWQNCKRCGRLYRTERTGCTNPVCELLGQGDEAQRDGSPLPQSTSTTKSTAKVSTLQRVPAVVEPKAVLKPIDAPEKIITIKVSPPHGVSAPEVVRSSNALPVIASVEGDPLARKQGSIDIRNQLLALDGGSIKSLVPGTLTKLGKGVNKQVYVTGNKQWVVAVVTAGQDEAKWRAVEAEIKQLMALRTAGVTVPSLGPVATADEALIEVCNEDGHRSKAFIEQFIKGEHNLCRQENHDYASKFANEIERVIGGRKAFDSGRWRNAKADLETLKAYFDKGTDIPDFQIVVEESTGHVYTIDPGDPLATGPVLDKHKAWVMEWLKVVKAYEPRK